MPTSPPVSFFQGFEKILARMRIADQVWRFGCINEGDRGPNYIELLREYEAAPRVDGVNSLVNQGRGILNSLIEDPATFLNPLLNVIAKSAEVGSQSDDPQEQLDDIYDYMHANGESIRSRALAFGSFASTSGTWNGSWKRCTKDANGYALDAAYNDTLKVRVEKDYTLGASWTGREVMSIRSALEFKDALTWGSTENGSGINEKSFLAVNADDSLLGNPNFSSAVQGTDADPEDLPQWTVSPAVEGDGDDFEIDRTASGYYQEAARDNRSPGGIKVKKTITLTQALRGGNLNITIDVEKPHYPGIRFNPADGSFVGSLQLSLGSLTKTIAISGQEPTAALNGAGNVTAGTHAWFVTFVDGSGVESGYSPASNVLTSVGSTVNLTNVALGPTGTASRRIYRTIAGNTGTPLLVGSIADNTTDVFTDNVADGSLGAAVTTTSHDGWVEFTPVTTDDEYWPENWLQNDTSFVVAVTRTSASGSYLRLNRCMLVPFKSIKDPNVTSGPPAMLWLLYLSGATPLTYRSAGTIEDESDDEDVGIAARWFQRGWGRILPHSTTPTIADPAAA